MEGGVELRIAVVERPVLRVLEYEGLKRISKTDLPPAGARPWFMRDVLLFSH